MYFTRNITRYDFRIIIGMKISLCTNMCKGREKILSARYLRKLLWENFRENVYLKLTSSLNFNVELNYLSPF